MSARLWERRAELLSSTDKLSDVLVSSVGDGAVWALKGSTDKEGTPMMTCRRLVFRTRRLRSFKLLIS